MLSELSDFGLSEEVSSQLTASGRLIGAGIIAAACVVVYFVCRKVFFPMVKHFTARTKATWDDHLLNDRVLNNGCYLLPALLAYVFMPLVFRGLPVALSLVDKGLLILIIVISVSLVCAFISSFNIISSESEMLKRRSLTGLYQMMKVVVICIGVILGVSVVLDKEPGVILTGLGASAAVLMLVFKDSIMGLVAGVQINVYDMLRPGDWIMMEKHGANGIVTAVTLNIVKVKNWDNTIITIPTYALVSESFQNWRGMWDAGGRRMKELVYVDITTIRACTAEQAEDYKALVADCPETANPTNLFFYRYYIERYLQSHPLVTPEPHLMVRQQPVSAYGLPVEVYCFLTKTQWVEYEHVKAEVMEFAYASLARFGLRAFQSPSGVDIANLKTNEA